MTFLSRAIALLLCVSIPATSLEGRIFMPQAVVTAHPVSADRVEQQALSVKPLSVYDTGRHNAVTWAGLLLGMTFGASAQTPNDPFVTQAAQAGQGRSQIVLEIVRKATGRPQLSWSDLGDRGPRLLDQLHETTNRFAQSTGLSPLADPTQTEPGQIFALPFNELEQLFGRVKWPDDGSLLLHWPASVAKWTPDWVTEVPAAWTDVYDLNAVLAAGAAVLGLLLVAGWLANRPAAKPISLLGELPEAPAVPEAKRPFRVRIKVAAETIRALDAIAGRLRAIPSRIGAGSRAQTDHALGRLRDPRALSGVGLTLYVFLLSHVLNRNAGREPILEEGTYLAFYVAALLLMVLGLHLLAERHKDDDRPASHAYGRLGLVAGNFFLIVGGAAGFVRSRQLAAEYDLHFGAMVASNMASGVAALAMAAGILGTIIWALKGSMRREDAVGLELRRLLGPKFNDGAADHLLDALIAFLLGRLWSNRSSELRPDGAPPQSVVERPTRGVGWMSQRGSVPLGGSERHLTAAA